MRILALRYLWLFFFLAATVVHAQERNITGTVSDEKGTALPGATVAVKNSKLSTMTSANGRFTLKIPATARVLVISYSGMEKEELSLGSKSSYAVILRPSITTLGDVVVVGYGTVRRSDVTGAATRLSREEFIRDNPTNILQALQGKLAGVNVTQYPGTWI